MSGHNKWSQIKHKKGKEDAKRGKVFSLLSRQITMEAKKVLGDKNAPGVKAVVDRARKENMPNDNIDRAIAKASGTNAESYEEVVFEAYGPGGVALIIEGITDNNNRTVQEIRHLLSENGGNLGTQGSAAWAFAKNETGHEPTTTIPLSETDKSRLQVLLEELEDHADTKRIFHNGL